MTSAAEDRNVVVNLQERKLDRTVLRTYRTRADIEDIVPNEKQPRLGPKIDEELQRQIERHQPGEVCHQPVLELTLKADAAREVLVALWIPQV